MKPAIQTANRKEPMTEPMTELIAAANAALRAAGWWQLGWTAGQWYAHLVARVGDDAAFAAVSAVCAAGGEDEVLVGYSVE